ncbi:hypothetical protein [Paenibacillus sp. RC84]|uniref:hypothetical protein n=1 Tax=Paenibacillus sp. RC84 TaxID=3156252 RepID=UPI0035120715
MKYSVLEEFIDYQTNEYYPAESEYETKDPAWAKRLQTLGHLGDEIKGDPSDDRLKHVGGGNFELPNGEKVRGKENALEALEKLEKDEKK